jgi:hypothetical protein
MKRIHLNGLMIRRKRKRNELNNMALDRILDPIRAALPDPEHHRFQPQTSERRRNLRAQPAIRLDVSWLGCRAGLVGHRNKEGGTMTRLVKGILIDPFACTVTEVEHDAERYEGIH